MEGKRKKIIMAGGTLYSKCSFAINQKRRQTLVGTLVLMGISTLFGCSLFLCYAKHYKQEGKKHRVSLNMFCKKRKKKKKKAI